MQFHEYTSLKNRILRDANASARQHYKSLTPSQFRGVVIKSSSSGAPTSVHYAYQAEAEGVWSESERPYYNVWPIAISLAESVKLSLTFSSLTLPFSRFIECVGGRQERTALLFRFALGHEPNGLCTALLDWRHTDKEIHIHAFSGDKDEAFFFERYEPHETVETWLARLTSRAADNPQSAVGIQRLTLLVRMTTFVSLLADDDLITPIVLSKDRNKCKSTDDPDSKWWLEERAARRAGRGFDLGKRLQVESDKSPHYRNPHLCLFWVGEGRRTPVIQMRSGGIIQRANMANVPTGYFGPETDDEPELSTIKTRRELFSKSRRFAIMKRDGYRCQLCGRSQEDGAKLHIDHRTPLVKGGSNEDENLWTLCEDCNLGKSTREV
jgi:hypothetical protein